MFERRSRVHDAALGTSKGQGSLTTAADDRPDGNQAADERPDPPKRVRFAEEPHTDRFLFSCSHLTAINVPLLDSDILQKWEEAFTLWSKR